MYIIIHKYQRWPVNVERPQSKYLKICLKTNKSNIKMMVSCSKSNSVGFHKRGKAICTLHFEGEIGRFLVFRHLHYANIRKSVHGYLITPPTE